MFKENLCNVQKIITIYYNNAYVYWLLFIILHMFGTRESIKWKIDHGGQIVL